MSVRRALDQTGMTFTEVATAMAVAVSGVLLVFSITMSVLSCMPFAPTAESRSPFGVTFKHDDHLWFRSNGGSAVHHPDCHCRRQE